jgi:hypothetical protein
LEFSRGEERGCDFTDAEHGEVKRAAPHHIKFPDMLDKLINVDMMEA